MPPPRANVLTHGHCMDGLASAVLFTRLLDVIEPSRRLSMSYRSCGYGPKLKSIPGGWLSGEVNAILDFRYAEDDRVTYFFDHHKTGFASPREEQTARERVAASGGRRSLFFDATCSSCAKLIQRVAKDSYGAALPGDPTLVEWADRVDSARFDDPEVAFFAREPALVLADVVERHGDTPFLARVVPELIARTRRRGRRERRDCRAGSPARGDEGGVPHGPAHVGLDARGRRRSRSVGGGARPRPASSRPTSRSRPADTPSSS
jgi:hypothetical protein